MRENWRWRRSPITERKWKKAQPARINQWVSCGFLSNITSKDIKQHRHANLNGSTLRDREICWLSSKLGKGWLFGGLDFTLLIPYGHSKMILSPQWRVSSSFKLPKKPEAVFWKRQRSQSYSGKKNDKEKKIKPCWSMVSGQSTNQRTDVGLNNEPSLQNPCAKGLVFNTVLRNGFWGMW